MMRRIFRWIVVWAARALVAVVGLGAVTYLAFTFVPAIGTASIGAVHESLAEEAGGVVGFDECRRSGPRRWRCQVSDTSLSGGVEYSVRTRGRRCWDARLLTRRVAWESPPPPRRPSGCAMLGDQFWGSSLGLS